MKPRFNAVAAKLGFLFHHTPENYTPTLNNPSLKPPILKFFRYWTTSAAASFTMPPSVVDDIVDNVICNTTTTTTVTIDEESRDSFPKDTEHVLRNWGCTDEDLSKIFHRHPSLRNGDVSNLESRLSLLSGLGLPSSHLIQIVKFRPRVLCSRNNQCCFSQRLEHLQELFGSKQTLLKAITRNPSLLNYDYHHHIKPVIAIYNKMGITQKDFLTMLLSRPTINPRTTFSEEKLDYIRKTGISEDSKMYKYVVTLIGITRIQTIRGKLSNLEKFGLLEDEVFRLIGRSPLILTLSIDKVRRNMTFILGTMKLSAKVVLDHPFLLFYNLDLVLKPRFLLAKKIEDMGLVPLVKEPEIFRALRMTDKRFFKKFVNSHPKEIVDELMEFYTNTKGIKRLAESSRKNWGKGFPF